MRLTSEPEARGSAATGRRRPVGLIRASERAGDDLLAFVKITAHDFRGRAVRDAEPHGHRLGLAVGADAPRATGRRAATAALTAREFVVPRLLLRREDLADARPHRVAQPLGLSLALLLGQAGAPERDHLLAHVIEDRVDLRLLLGRQVEGLHEPLSHLLAATLTASLAFATALPSAAPTGGGHHVGAFARGTEPQRGVGDLQDVGLL